MKDVHVQICNETNEWIQILPIHDTLELFSSIYQAHLNAEAREHAEKQAIERQTYHEIALGEGNFRWIEVFV